MSKLKQRLISMLLLIIILFSGINAVGLNQKTLINQINEELNTYIDNELVSDDFYFVHITDTHIRHRIFDRKEIRKEGSRDNQQEEHTQLSV